MSTNIGFLGVLMKTLINFSIISRFKKCLEAGMKPSWVLSDEERNRRFNKFNKLQIKSSNSDPRLARKSANIRVPELYITFTMEEQKLIGFIKNKMNFCQQSWLRNLLNYGNFSLLIKRECILNCWIAQFDFNSNHRYCWWLSKIFFVHFWRKTDCFSLMSKL